MANCWKCIHIHTTQEAEDIMSSILCELGFDGIEIQDSVQLSETDRKKLFIDFLPDLDESDHSATITCYMDCDASVEERIKEIEESMRDYEGVVDFGNYSIEVTETKQEDWINNWKKYFKSFRIDEQILVKPTWEALPETKEGDLVIEIDPGTAFGTGAHETTKLCILNLKKYLKEGDRLLDVGCGSGILTIVGKMLGADVCNAIDIDPIAVTVSKENTLTNHLPLSEQAFPQRAGGQISYFEGDIIGNCTFRESFGLNFYDIVVANILADVIVPLSSVIAEVMKPGSLFISSGIINTKEEEVRTALLQNEFEIVEVTRMKEWVSFIARKKEN